MIVRKEDSGAAVVYGGSRRVCCRQVIHLCTQHSQSNLVILRGVPLHKEECEGKGLVFYLGMNYLEPGKSRRGDRKGCVGKPNAGAAAKKDIFSGGKPNNP